MTMTTTNSTQTRGKAWVALVEMLAEEFAARVRRALTEDELRDVREFNADEIRAGFGSVCHSGDFCDSNQLMLDSRNALGLADDLGLRYGFETDGNPNTIMDRLHDEAWYLAKAREFRPADEAEIVGLEREIGEDRLEAIKEIIEQDRRIKAEDRREFLQTVAFRLKAAPETTNEAIAEEWMEWQDGSDDGWE